MHEWHPQFFKNLDRIRPWDSNDMIPGHSMVSFHFINVCWGVEYSKMCVEEMLPTLLSPGNFADPALSGRAKFIFYTTPADYERMKAFPAVQRLAQLMEIVVFDVSDLQRQLGPGGSKYTLMNACHRHATVMGGDQGAAVVFLCPDLVVSDGLCRRLVELVDAGKSAVLIAGARLSRNDFHRLTTELWNGEASCYPGIAPRELIGIALQTMTRYTQSIFWDSADVNLRPNQLAWRVDPSGYFMRGLHLHPLMMRPEVGRNLPIGTIDGHFLAEACPHSDRYYFVEDSDEFSAFSLTSFDEFPEIQVPGRYSEEAIAAYISGRAEDIGKQHLLFVRKVLRFHTHDLNEKWAPLEAESNRILSGIFHSLGANRSRDLSQENWAKTFKYMLQTKHIETSASA